MIRKKLRKAAAETPHTAAERATAALEEAVTKLAPLLEQAGDTVGPMAEEARGKAAELTASALTTLQPHLQTAREKVSPAVTSAKKQFEDDVLPKLMEMFSDAQQHPLVAEATRRGEATLAALRGDIEVPKVEVVEVKKKGGFWKGLLKVLAVTTALAGVAVAVKKLFLDQPNDGWTAHQPSEPYRVPNRFAATSEDKAAHEVTEDLEESAAEAVADPEASVKENSPEPVKEIKTPEYPGSYVGDEPNPDYPIKGNTRSMKYHVPGSGGFERTITDVWFATEADAEAAGFVKAQR